MSGSLEYNMEFEAEVRRAAEAVWGLSPGECQPGHYPNDPVVREIDGIARLRDITHLLMATTSTKLNKLTDDVRKLGASEVLERRKALAVSKWMITERQLDAQHIEVARKSNVTVLTLDQFRRRFFDGRKYLSLRERAAFGSARNPTDDSITFPDNAYVPLPIRMSGQDGGMIGADKIRPSDIVGIEKISLAVENGAVIVLVAPFGGGKSLTTREVFRHLANRYRSGKSHFVPMVLNLREHWGQEHFDEILERHARSIGYMPREDLVIAWRAGLVSILFDGFDEVASQAVVRRDDKNFMRDARRLALKGVRDFLMKIPSGVGVWFCGRDHYFDSLQELNQSLGISTKNPAVLELGEFTEERANDYLRRHGIKDPIPDWLPRKPLLLAYLTQRSLFSEILAIDGSQGFGHAWDAFLSRISDREAGLENAVMEASTLRGVLERLANTARSRASGSGPITGTDLSDAYMAETGQSAGEGVLAQLQRLPGLTHRDQDPGARSFVDEDMLAALQGSAFAKTILEQRPFERLNPVSGLRKNSVSMATYLLKRGNATASSVVATMERLARTSSSEIGGHQFLGDCLSVAISLAIDEGTSFIDCRGVVIRGAVLEDVDATELQIDGIEIQDCIIGRLALSQTGVQGSMRFRSCLISSISGVANRNGLPQDMFDPACEIEAFDNLATNNAVLRSDLAPQVKALATVLRKLYCQAGAGRKIEAMHRGITQAEVDRYIQPVLELLQREGFVSIYNKVVHPVRRQHDRVNRILNAPALSDDPLVVTVSRLP